MSIKYTTKIQSDLQKAGTKNYQLSQKYRFELDKCKVISMRKKKQIKNLDTFFE